MTIGEPVSEHPQVCDRVHMYIVYTSIYVLLSLLLSLLRSLIAFSRAPRIDVHFIDWWLRISAHFHCHRLLFLFLFAHFSDSSKKIWYFFLRIYFSNRKNTFICFENVIVFSLINMHTKRKKMFMFPGIMAILYALIYIYKYILNG